MDLFTTVSRNILTISPGDQKFMSLYRYAYRTSRRLKNIRDHRRAVCHRLYNGNYLCIDLYA